MAIPTQPTETSIVTKAFRIYGKSPTSTDITNAIDSGLAMVKSDLMDEGRSWKFLRSKAIRACTINSRRIQAPTDFSKIISVVMCDGDRTGTAQGGTSSSITLAASEDASESDLVGYDIAIKSGTGANQIAQIIAYNSSTKVATIDGTWTSPDSSSTYLIVEEKRNCNYEDIWDFDDIEIPYTQDCPQRVFHEGDDAEGDFIFDYVPDEEYVAIIRYYSNLKKMDTDTTANPRYARILRLLEQLFIQGTLVYLLQDDNRAPAEKRIYASMLQRTAGHYLLVATQAGLAEDVY